MNHLFHLKFLKYHLNLMFTDVPLEPDVPLVPDEPLEPEVPEEPDVTT
jgi:hypothetical protein